MPLQSVHSVLICDDHLVCCRGIQSALETSLNPRVQYSFARTGAEVLSLLSTMKPDLVFLDLKLPDMSGLEILREIRDRKISAKIIVLTGCDQIAFLKQALEFDIKGLLWKSCSDQLLSEAVWESLRSSERGTFIDPEIRQLLDGDPTSSLTPREFEVAGLLTKGHTNREIGELLSCSPETVKTHRANIMRKTHATSRAELIAWYLEGQNR